MSAPLETDGFVEDGEGRRTAARLRLSEPEAEKGDNPAFFCRVSLLPMIDEERIYAGSRDQARSLALEWIAKRLGAQRFVDQEGNVVLGGGRQPIAQGPGPRGVSGVLATMVQVNSTSMRIVLDDVDRVEPSSDDTWTISSSFTFKDVARAELDDWNVPDEVFTMVGRAVLSRLIDHYEAERADDEE